MKFNSFFWRGGTKTRESNERSCHGGTEKAGEPFYVWNFGCQ